MDTNPKTTIVKHKDALPRVKSGSAELLSNILTLADDKLKKPFELGISGSIISIAASEAQHLKSDGSGGTESANKVAPVPESTGYSVIGASSIDVSDGTGTGDLESATPSIPVTVGASEYVWVGFEKQADDKVHMVWGTPDAVALDAGVPAFTSSTGFKAIGMILLQDDGTGSSGTSWNFVAPLDSNITVFEASGSGSGSGGSGSGGGELADLPYSAAVRDEFDTVQDGTTSVDTSAGKTDSSLYAAANQYYRLNYDAAKTVTCTDDAAVMSAGPAFTVKVGDVLIVGDEVRKITVVTDQTNYTIESAFSVDPSASACCVSQAVHTVDLNDFDFDGQSVAANTQFFGDIYETLVSIEDSELEDDKVPDWGVTAKIAYMASADGLSWSDKRSRTQYMSETANPVAVPVASDKLYLVFFANKTTGSGQVNLLSFKAFWHDDGSQMDGETLFTAYANITANKFVGCSHVVVDGKSRFIFDEAYPVGLNAGDPSGSALNTYGDGKLVPRYIDGTLVSPGSAYVKELNEYTIEMDTDYSASGADWIFRVPATVIDTNTQNTSNIANIQDYVTEALQDFIVQDEIDAPYTEIVNRAKVVNLANDLMPRMGVNRVMTQDLIKLQDEFGPNGEDVYRIANDEFNQIRFVGAWGSDRAAQGSRIYSQSDSSYMEITANCTGLNILSQFDGTPRVVKLSVDGGAEVALSTPLTSTVLSSRNYAPQLVTPVVSGLPLGIHTFKLRNDSAATNIVLNGIEIVNESLTLKVPTGQAFVNRKPVQHNSLDAIAYNSDFESGVLGTRGGHVLTYLKSDGTIGKAVTPTGSAAYFPSANHSTEELTRLYHFSEFGANRSDDFSTLAAATSDRAFTLDDGTTTLVGKDTSVDSGNMTCLWDGFFTLTFVGTGLDIEAMRNDTAVRDFNIYIDGVLAISAWQPTETDALYRTYKICSGLSYGTHTVQFYRNASNTSYGSMALRAFKVYAPKQPSLPVNATKLSNYFVMADYVANTTPSALDLASGILRKDVSRELTYVGSWAIDESVNYIGYWRTYTNTNGNYCEYTFYGTGLELRNYTDSVTASQVTMSVDGSSDLSGYNVSVYGVNAIISQAAGTFNLNGATTYGNGISLSGLPLGKHTIRITNNTTEYFVITAFDIITPIHSPKSNSPASYQNTLTVGSQAICDLRELTAIKEDGVPLNHFSATGVAASPTTTVNTGYVPLPDMGGVLYTTRPYIRISFRATTQGSTVSISANAFVDGQQIPTQYRTEVRADGANGRNQLVLVARVPVSIGFHRVVIQWTVNTGTATAYSTSRNLLVEECEE